MSKVRRTYLPCRRATIDEIKCNVILLFLVLGSMIDMLGCPIVQRLAKERNNGWLKWATGMYGPEVGISVHLTNRHARSDHDYIIHAISNPTKLNVTFTLIPLWRCGKWNRGHYCGHPSITIRTASETKELECDSEVMSVAHAQCGWCQPFFFLVLVLVCFFLDRVSCILTQSLGHARPESTCM